MSWPIPFLPGVLLLFSLMAGSAAQGDPARLPRMGVGSPAIGAEIAGETPLAILAPGFSRATVRCWRQGEGFGSDSVVGTTALDAQGKGIVVFPADDYPHGPITLRITGEVGGGEDTFHLQLYNMGGVPWNEGIPASIPPGAKGMTLAFSDDFDGALSISRTGAGARYASHKPGGGDFSPIPFADYESPQNPFARLGTWLRIRIDRKRNAAGLLSSLGLDGTGFAVSAPCYFECRFLAQSAPVTWPAFWVLTREAAKGLKEPADELDIIEGYGGTGPKMPNQKGYWVTSHTWNQDARQPGVYQQIPMEKVGGGASWWTTFHTYGCRIGETDTVYYCDDIEVARHPTSRLCRTRPLFFLVNFAAPGAGWPLDLSQYGGIVDMYVDYVRVFAGGDDRR